MQAIQKMVNFLTVAAKHCRKAEHSLRLAAGFFNVPSLLINPIIWNLFVFKISNPDLVHTPKNPRLQISKILAGKVEFRPLETEPKNAMANYLQLPRTKRKERLTMAVMLFLIGLVRIQPLKRGLTTIGSHSNFRVYAHNLGAAMNQGNGFQRIHFNKDSSKPQYGMVK